MPVPQWFGIMAGRSSSVALQTVLWSASDHNSDLTISVDQITATRTSIAGSSRACGRADTYNSAGKFYFEVNASADNAVAGIMMSATSLTGDVFPGSDTTGVGFSTPDGNWYYNGVLQAAAAATGAGRICFAYDLGASLFWVARAAGNWNASGAANPVTGVGGFTIPGPAAVNPVTPTQAMNKIAGAGGTMALITSGALARPVPSGFLLQAPS